MPVPLHGGSTTVSPCFRSSGRRPTPANGDGTSTRAPTPGSLTDELVDRLDGRDERIRTGPTWTADASFRETRSKVERYAAEGVLAVEMEAAAAFAAAGECGVEAAAAFSPSDYLGPDAWEPRFQEAGTHLRDLGDRIVSALG